MERRASVGYVVEPMSGTPHPWQAQRRSAAAIGVMDAHPAAARARPKARAASSQSRMLPGPPCSMNAGLQQLRRPVALVGAAVLLATLPAACEPRQPTPAGPPSDPTAGAAEAGRSCGVVAGRKPAFRVRVERGNPSCRQARVLLGRYFDAAKTEGGEGSAAYLAIRGWQCSVAPPGAFPNLAHCTRGEEEKIAAVRLGR